MLFNHSRSLITSRILNASPILFFQEFRYWKSFSLWCCQQNLHCHRQFPCGYAVLRTVLWHDWRCNRRVVYIRVSSIHVSARSRVTDHQLWERGPGIEALGRYYRKWDYSFLSHRMNSVQVSQKPLLGLLFCAFSLLGLNWSEEADDSEWFE